MRVSLRLVAGSLVCAAALAGCSCEPMASVDVGPDPADASMVDARRVDAFELVEVGPPRDSGRDTGPMNDVGTDAAMVSADCGDGVIDALEECDDGGMTAGDGCDATCAIESGYSCAGEPSVCSMGCGNGLIVAPETCDDGRLDDGDGCSSACQIEAGWTCAAGEPTSACTTDCGDGVAAVGVEECDDGNMTDGDGCDEGVGPDTGAGPDWLPACLTTRCGNGIPTTGETCDDGNTTAGDGCDAMCQVE